MREARSGNNACACTHLQSKLSFQSFGGLMKRSSLMFLAVGMLAGFGTGYALKGQRAAEDSPEPAAQIEPEPRIEPALAPRVATEEKELLLQAIEELDLTTTELESAKDYIRKLERNTQRYNWLMDYWKEKGFGTSHRMNLSSYNSFKPTDEISDFFGWNEEQVKQLSKAGKQAKQAIKDWERDHSTCIEETENKLVYQIEAIPQTIVDQYKQTVYGIIDTDDYELLATKLDKNFDGPIRNRTATLTIGPAPENMHHSLAYGPDKDCMIIKIEPEKDENGHRTGMHTSYMPYTLGKTIPQQYNHIFQLEGEEGFTLPDGSWVPASR